MEGTQILGVLENVLIKLCLLDFVDLKNVNSGWIYAKEIGTLYPVMKQVERCHITRILEVQMLRIQICIVTYKKTFYLIAFET